MTPLILETILRDCGRLLLELSRTKQSGVWEGEQFKADADREAHKFLVEALAQKQQLPVVSEEDASDADRTYDAYVIIDPIDGTASFAHGFGGWVTQAAVMNGEIPVLAGIFVPVTGEYFGAVKGGGAYRNGERLRLDSADSRLITIIDNYPEPRGITLELKNALGIPRYVESGSIALKICRIADGTADLFFKANSPRDWDLAAPQLVLEEAGGQLTDARGNKLAYGLPGRRHQGLIAARNVEQARRAGAWYCAAVDR